MDDVADLGHGHPDARALSLGKHPFAGDGAGGISGGEEEHVMARILEAAGQLIDHQLDAAVEQGRDGGPQRRDLFQSSCRDSSIPRREGVGRRTPRRRGRVV